MKTLFLILLLQLSTKQYLLQDYNKKKLGQVAIVDNNVYIKIKNSVFSFKLRNTIQYRGKLHYIIFNDKSIGSITIYENDMVIETVQKDSIYHSYFKIYENQNF